MTRAPPPSTTVMLHADRGNKARASTAVPLRSPPGRARARHAHRHVHPTTPCRVPVAPRRHAPTRRIPPPLTPPKLLRGAPPPCIAATPASTAGPPPGG
eukprot:1083013-Prorocentrum_minimum.AAC.1